MNKIETNKVIVDGIEEFFAKKLRSLSGKFKVVRSKTSNPNRFNANVYLNDLKLHFNANMYEIVVQFLGEEVTYFHEAIEDHKSFLISDPLCFNKLWNEFCEEFSVLLENYKFKEKTIKQDLEDVENRIWALSRIRTTDVDKT